MGSVSGLGAPRAGLVLGTMLLSVQCQCEPAEWHLPPQWTLPGCRPRSTHVIPLPAPLCPPTPRHSPLRRSTGLERQLMLCQLFLVT